MNNMFNSKLLDEIKTVGVIGYNPDQNLNTAISIARLYGQEKIYLISQRPVYQDGIISSSSREDLINVPDNSVAIIHDYQKFFPRENRDANTDLRKNMEMCKEHDVRLILTNTSNKDIDRQTELLVDAWAIKQLNPKLLRNGSIVKLGLSEIKSPDITESGLRLGVSEFFWYAPYTTTFGSNGKYGFPVEVPVEIVGGNVGEEVNE